MTRWRWWRRGRPRPGPVRPFDVGEGEGEGEGEIMVNGRFLTTVLAAEAGRVADGHFTHDWRVAAGQGAA